MTKRLSFLSGLAILAVVCNHAAGWGFTAMFWWADRYRSVSTPNFDQVGSLTYYALTLLKQLTLFSVPAFLFISGYFVAYAGRGRSTLSWTSVRVRLTYLLIPYAVWSAVIFAGDALQGISYAPVEYLEQLVSGGADVPYFYVPLLCQFYLLSPLLTAVARTRGRLLLLVSALLQLGAMGIAYLDLLGEAVLNPQLSLLYAEPLFFRWAFFFSLGVVGGFHLKPLKEWGSRHKGWLLAAAVVLALLSVVEAEVIYRCTGQDWRGHVDTVSASPYAVAFIMCFLAFESVPMQQSKTIHNLGRRSYGIYLIHGKALEFIARVVRQFAPWILASQAVFQPLLVAMAVGLPVLLMTIVIKTPARRSYRYLFG